MNKLLKKLSAAVLCICVVSLLLYGCNAGVIVNNETEYNQTIISTSEAESTDKAETESKTSSETVSVLTSEAASGSSEKETSKGKETTANKETTTQKVADRPYDKTTTEAAVKPEATTEEINYCTVIIECTSILNNMDKLAEGHEKYVPGGGYILSSYKVTYNSGDTAYDILKRACSDNGIKLSARQTQYGTYVSGINNLDEKDCGSQSGWLYYVNGVSPSYSCGKYKVSAGDSIKFSYTCSG